MSCLKKISLPLTFFYFLFASTLQAQSDSQEKRLALVIGNSNYDEGYLKNPVNDALLISKALDSLGFDIILDTNLATRRDFTNAIRRFGNQRNKYDVAFVYYAGHGIQIGSENFLLPTKESFNNEDEVLDFGVSVQNILRYLNEVSNKVNILVLDACRNNPFERKWDMQRSLNEGKGLAKIPPPTGSLIAFSTESGTTAADGNGNNSVYCMSLYNNILKADISLDQVFRNVRSEVLDKTSGVQRPIEASQLTGNTFFLNEKFLSQEIAQINRLIAISDFKKAEVFLEKAIQLNPADERLIHLKLKLLRLQEKYKEVEIYVKDISPQRLSNKDIFWEYTESLIDENSRLENALENITTLLENEKNNTTYLTSLMRCLYRIDSEFYNDSINAILKATELLVKDSYDYKDYFNLGLQFWLVSQHQSSFKAYEHGYSFNSDEATSALYLQRMSDLFDYVSSEEFKSFSKSFEQNVKMILERFDDNFINYHYYSKYLLRKSFITVSDSSNYDILLELIDICTKGIQREQFLPLYIYRAIGNTNLSYNSFNLEPVEDLFELAISDYFFVSENFERDNLSYREDFIPFYISKLYQSLENYESMYRELNRSLEIQNERDLAPYYVVNYDLAVACYYLNETEEALENCRYYRQHSRDSSSIAKAYFLEAEIFNKLQEPDSMLISLKNSILYDFEGFDAISSTGVKYNSALVRLFQLATTNNNLNLATELFKDYNSVDKDFNVLCNAVISTIENPDETMNIQFDVEKYLIDLEDWYNLRVFTSYIYFLWNTEDYLEIIHLCKNLDPDSGFLFILSSSYYQMGDLFNSIETLGKCKNSIELDQLNTNFREFVDIEILGKYSNMIRSQIQKN